MGERSIGVLHPYVYRLADIFQSHVAHQGAGQQTGLAQNLKAVADPEHQSAAVSELLDRFHHRREFSDGASAQVIAEGKAAGNDDGIAVLQVMRLVPEECNRLLRNLLDGPIGIVIAIRSRENDDAEFHPSFLAEGYTRV